MDYIIQYIRVLQRLKSFWSDLSGFQVIELLHRSFITKHRSRTIT
jgi:hypothetical protein